MGWNWQKPDWPNFRWDTRRLVLAEREFLISGGVLAGSIKHLGSEESQQLAVETMSTEAVATSEIEGEVLDRASVQSSIRRQLGLATDKRKAGPAEEGIAQMMVDLFRSWSAPLSETMLCDWHTMLMRGRKDLIDVGRYRTSREPMQIVSGRVDDPTVHFEAPPSSQVPAEMSRFIEWFNRTAPDGSEPFPGLTRAGVAHLYFESIHPFEDGNGRIGRALAEKAFSQSLGQATLTSLASAILACRKSYYLALEAATQGNEITGWLAWFGGIALEAQRRTLALVGFLIEKTRLLDRLKGRINDRQEKVLLHMLREGPEGFKGGMSAGKYATITGASPATTTRDLADLVDKNVLVRQGELRHTRYHLDLPLQAVKHLSINARGEIVET